MVVLREAVVWRFPVARDRTRRSSDLTPDEQANVKTAIRFMQIRLGTQAKLADAMRARPLTIQSAMKSRGKVSAGIALRLARVAGVPLEDVLAGAFPAPGACPRCGRSA